MIHVTAAEFTATEKHHYEEMELTAKILSTPFADTGTLVSRGTVAEMLAAAFVRGAIAERINPKPTTKTKPATAAA